MERVEGLSEVERVEGLCEVERVKGLSEVERVEGFGEGGSVKCCMVTHTHSKHTYVHKYVHSSRVI